MAGRPTKLTPALHQEIVRLVEAGNYLEVAALAAGVHRRTLHLWMRTGARARRETPYRRFWREVRSAMARAEARDVTRIAVAASQQWQAAAWRLERKAPQRWGRRDRLDVTQALPREELRALMAAIGAIVQRHVQDPDVIARIRAEWSDLLERATTPSPTRPAHADRRLPPTTDR